MFWKVCYPAPWILPAPNFDPYHFTYKVNQSLEEAITIALHMGLNHLELQGSYVRMLFIDYSSELNTIIPDILVEKIYDLHITPSICSWIKDFLTDRLTTGH